MALLISLGAPPIARAQIARAQIAHAQIAHAGPVEVPLVQPPLRWGMSPLEVTAQLGALRPADPKAFPTPYEGRWLAMQEAVSVQLGRWRTSAWLLFFRGRLFEIYAQLPASRAEVAAAIGQTGPELQVSLRARGPARTSFSLKSRREQRPWLAIRDRLQRSREYLSAIHPLTADTVLFDYDGDGADDVAILTPSRGGEGLAPELTVLVGDDGPLRKRRLGAGWAGCDLEGEHVLDYWLYRDHLILYLSGPGASGETLVEVARVPQCAADPCALQGEPTGEALRVAGRRYVPCSLDCQRGDRRCRQPPQRPVSLETLDRPSR